MSDLQIHLILPRATVFTKLKIYLKTEQCNDGIERTSRILFLAKFPGIHSYWNVCIRSQKPYDLLL